MTGLKYLQEPFYRPFLRLFVQVYSNTPETINLIIEVFVEVAHKQICYLGEVGQKYNLI